MPAVNLMIDKDAQCSASGALLGLKPMSPTGHEAAVVDVKLRFDLFPEDSPILSPMFPFPGAHDAEIAFWGPLENTDVKGRVVHLMLQDLEGAELFQGSATVRKCQLACKELVRSMVAELRVQVPEDCALMVKTLKTIVRATVRGVEQPEKKSKGSFKDDPGQQKIVFGRKVDGDKVPKVAILVEPEEGQVVEYRTGATIDGKPETRWAICHGFEDLGPDSVVTLKDIADGREKQRLPVGWVAAAYDVQAEDGKKLQGLVNRHRSAVKKAGHNLPASWTYVMRAAHASPGLVKGQPVTITQDILDRAAEMVEDEAEKVNRMNQQRGIEPLPPAAEV